MASLAKYVDKFVAARQREQMRGFVVLLAENSKENREALAKLASDHELSIPLTVSLQGAAGPKAYQIQPEAPITVLLCRRSLVNGNYVLADPAPEDDAARRQEAMRILRAAQAMLKRR